MSAKHAYYLLQGEHLRDPEINVTLKDYDIIVCNPAVPVSDIREWAPDATLLAYFGAHMIPDYGRNNDFYISMRDTMSKHYLFGTTGASVGGVPMPITDSYGNYELQLTFDAARDYAEWINENIQSGMDPYIDELWGTPPASFLGRTQRDTSANHVLETGSRWKYWTRYLVGQLEFDIIVGNVGRHPEYAVPALSSITIEKNHIEAMGNDVYRHFYDKITAGGGEHNVGWGTDGLPNLFAKGEDVS